MAGTSARWHDLPTQPTALIGREREIADVGALLCRPVVRLLTLTGPGGTGKTRVALAVAASLRDAFAGVHFVDLAPINNPDLVLSTIAQALNVVQAGSDSLFQRLTTVLCDRQLLLVLDNFEQVLAASLLLIDMLAACPDLKILITSRAPLRLHAEQEFPVPPLPAPDPRRLPEWATLSQYDAVRLFIQRAQAVKPDFQVTNENALAVAEICARLDGLPLAIELAAARSKVLTPDAMLARLGNRLKLLTGGAHDLPTRQQTLRSTIDWSYELLDPSEQRLFARLAVFAGGRTLEAIEAVCNTEGDLPIDPLDGVASLVDKNLLRQEGGIAGEPRFVMLETIHEYARERLEASGEAELIHRRHAEYFLALAEQAEPELLGAEQRTWLERLEAEHNNLRAALQWCLEHAYLEQAARLCISSWLFWVMRGNHIEGRRWLDKVLASRNMLPLRIQANALRCAGNLAMMLGSYDQARTLLDEGLEKAHEVEDRRSIAWTLNDQGILLNLQGHHEAAKAIFEQSLALWRELGDKQGISMGIGNLAEIARLQGNLERALVLGEEALALDRELSSTWGIAISLLTLGSTYLSQGNPVRARILLQESLVLQKDLRFVRNVPEWLETMAGVVTLEGEPERAARLLGAADHIRQQIGIPLSRAEQPLYDQYVTATRAQLDELTWKAAWADGQTMSLEAAFEYALTAIEPPLPEAGFVPAVGQPISSSTGTLHPAALTEREIDVLRLLAQGLSDKEIAEKLIISPRTVNTHLRTIYGKLGVTSRTAAARWASEHHIL